MQVHLTNLNEPIPGYRLLEPLGRGGFGEVWKAEAPGGLLKAIKIVHGSFDSAVGGEEPVQKELRSLNCVKSVRHPFILSLDRYDVISGQLLIVMELADRSLWDRFEESKKQGLPGIPREELLHYMAEASEALDLMSQRYDLQHSDVKPQNLFLVHNHVKVADFGLVRDLEGMKATAGSGVSPLYAAPESFHGWVSRYSDQYSLAVVYQELLTGKRPFDGTNARQLLMQHVQSPPVLDPLPTADRPVVYRALRKEPDERFPSCTDFVEALRGKPVPPAATTLRNGQKSSGSGSDLKGQQPAKSGTTLRGAAPAKSGASLKPSSASSSSIDLGAQRRTALARPHAPTNTTLVLDKSKAILAVRCPSCGFTGQVPATFQCKAIRCRSCAQVFALAGFVDAVPAPAAETEPRPTETEDSKATVPVMEAATTSFVEVECPACGNCGPIPETYRGRRLKCRQCGCVHREGQAEPATPK
jgi:serine/threonine protein kinase